MGHRRLLALAATALLVTGLGTFLPRAVAPGDPDGGGAADPSAPLGAVVRPAITRPLAELAAEYPVTGDGRPGLPPAEAAFEAGLEGGEAETAAETEAEREEAERAAEVAGGRPNRIGDQLAGRERLPLPRSVARVPRALDPTLASTGPIGAAGAATVYDGTTGLGSGKVGVGSTFSVQYAPPDLAMDVGDRQIVQAINVGLMVFDKASLQVQVGPVAIRSLWSTLPSSNPCRAYDDGDPQVRWDARAKRWIVGQFAVSGSTDYMCLAVSRTSDALGAWAAYAFSKSLFPDYPKLSIWGDSYWVTYNMFGRTYQYATVCSYERQKMLDATTATERCFNTSAAYASLLAADLDGEVPPPPGMRQVMVSLGSDTSKLAFWRRASTDAASISTVAPDQELTVGAYTIACGDGGACIPQASDPTKLDSLGDRLMARFAVRMDPSGEFATGLVAHSVDSDGITGVRWYRIRLEATGGISILDSRTWSPDTTYHRWMPSMASNEAGEIALGYSRSGTSQNPSIQVTGRVGTSGQLDVQETALKAAGGAQVSTYSRWGDYTQMAVDPDGCSFWYVNEFYGQTASFRWQTWIRRFELPGSGCSPSDASYDRTATSLSTSVSSPLLLGKPYTIRVTLTSGGSPVVGRTVWVSGAKRGSAVTGTDGTAIFTYTAPRKPATLAFVFTYAGDAASEPASGARSIPFN